MIRTHRALVAFLMLVAFAGVALAAPPAHYFSNPVDACEHDRTLDRVLRDLKKDGFRQINVEEQVIYYFVEPTGDHVWGTITYTNIRNVGGDYSLQTDYAKVTAEVTYYEGLGYRISKITTEETTVY